MFLFLKNRIRLHFWQGNQLTGIGGCIHVKRKYYRYHKQAFELFWTLTEVAREDDKIRIRTIERTASPRNLTATIQAVEEDELPSLILDFENEINRYSTRLRSHGK